jgi:4-methyl-5(b-hydroxyethyl)-thiazole monophosphate biosynthesis
MVYIFLAPGFEEAEALVPADLLRRAGIETALVALDGDSVCGAHAITVQADRHMEQVDLSRADMIVLPGGSEGVRGLGESPAVEAMIQEAVDRGIWLAAICAAPTLLGRWGFLQGKQAVCYPTLEGGLLGAEVDHYSDVVVDGKLVTGRAAGSAFDFGLKLVEVLSGPDKAEEVRRAVCYH